MPGNAEVRIQSCARSIQGRPASQLVRAWETKDLTTDDRPRRRAPGLAASSQIAGEFLPDISRRWPRRRLSNRCLPEMCGLRTQEMLFGVRWANSDRWLRYRIGSYRCVRSRAWAPRTQ